MRRTELNFAQRCRLPFVVAALACCGTSPGAVEALLPTPLAIAESESFEAVGRLTDEGLSWFVDRADSNAPVLGARLEVEANGERRVATYRPEKGDYLITDTAWLKPLRQAGGHALALTLLAGEESDLLATELQVTVASATTTVSHLRLGGAAVGLLLTVAAVLGLRRWKQGGRS